MTIFLEFIVLVILVIGLLIINLTRTGKLIIGVIGVLTIGLTSIATSSLPYNQYRTVINIVVVTIPLVIMIISYLGLKKRFKKVQ